MHPIIKQIPENRPKCRLSTTSSFGATCSNDPERLTVALDKFKV